MTSTHPGVDIAATHRAASRTSPWSSGSSPSPARSSPGTPASPARASSGACRWPSLAVVLGFVALRAGADARWAAITGIVLGGAMVAMIVVWTLAAAG